MLMQTKTITLSTFLIFLYLIEMSTPLRNLDWATYKSAYGKSYTDLTEDASRQTIYKDRLDTLTAMSANTSITYDVDINPFTDWTDQQLRCIKCEYTLDLMSGVKQVSNPRGDSFDDFKTGDKTGVRRMLASYTNWQGKFRGVRDQGKGCASAWAFALTEMSEASVQLKQGNSENFAEQYLIQCTSYSNCDGGYLERGLEEIINGNGMPLQSSYPYDPSRRYSTVCSTNSKVYVAQYSYNFYGLSDSQMIELLQYGPIAVRVSSEGWNYYSGGVYECPEGSSTNHAVLLVGVTGSYWIVQNSWGTRWGESGYMRISRTRSKNCGLGTAVHVLSESFISPLALLLTIFLSFSLILQ